MLPGCHDDRKSKCSEKAQGVQCLWQKRSKTYRNCIFSHFRLLLYNADSCFACMFIHITAKMFLIWGCVHNKAVEISSALLNKTFYSVQYDLHV